MGNKNESFLGEVSARESCLLRCLLHFNFVVGDVQHVFTTHVRCTQSLTHSLTQSQLFASIPVSLNHNN
jgi:hypothetical protein